jgi:serine/threonine protein kinase
MEPRRDIVGSHIGQYRIVKKIGSGGMGTVFLGEHILLGRRAAIKTLLPVLSMQSEIVDRFFKEAKATSAINDPGVVQIFDFGYHVDGTAYIVMELLEGEALSERIARFGQLPPAESLRITRQVAGALAAAHAAGIVHRDLKPENVFMVSDPEAQSGERAKLIDFGICKMTDETTNTQTGRMMGTPVYMSPEQCQGAHDVDGRADIYSLGCLLFHTLTGRVPFDLDGTGDLIVAHLQTPAPAPSSVAPELPILIDEIVEHCLAKDPAERFQSMAAVQHAIDQVLPTLTPAPQREIPVGLALGAGFKSNYDGNHDPGTRDSRASWFVDESPTPALTGELHRPHSGNKSLAAILVSGAIVAVIVAMVMRTHSFASEDEKLAGVIAALPAEKEEFPMFPEPEETTPPAPSEPPPDPDDGEPKPEIQQAPDPEPEIQPADPEPEVGTPDDKPEVDPRADKPESEGPIDQPKAASARPAIKKPVQRPRRVIKRPAPKPQPEVEDLYETR